MLKLRYLVAGAVTAASLAACGGTQSSVTSTTASPSIAGTTTPMSAAGQASLPPPCSLLTIDEVSPLFGTMAITATPSSGPAPGTAQCSFSLTAGSQGKTVSIKTRDNYANDPSYVFPSSPTKVAGLGDAAVVETTNTQEGRITVRLGKNAIEITVSFYDKPVDNAFLTQLAKDAVAHA